jgi:hypothetical protein
MTFRSLKTQLAGATVAASMAFVVACSGTSPSMNPTAPTAAANSAAAGANFSPNPTACPLDPPWITDPSDKDGCVCPPPNIFDEAANTCTPPEEPPPPGLEGCTPGYWKGNAKKGADQWPLPLSPSSTVGDAGFAAGSYNDLTLLAALELGGGSGVAGATQNLLRAAVAALLNAQNVPVDYPLSAAQIIAQVNAAIAGGDRAAILALAATLDGYNNLGCPIDNNGA